MSLEFNTIPKFCISLKRSTERRKLVSEEFNKKGLDVTFFDAIDKNEISLPELSIKKNPRHDTTTRKGILACMISHIRVLQEAKKNKLAQVCIFEDDIVFCDDFHERIKYIELLKDFDFDFFALGGQFSPQAAENKNNTQWGHIKRIDGMLGAYAYIITEKAYGFVLRNITYQYSIDYFYLEEVYKRFNCYGFLPFLCGCVPCVSEITGYYIEYENIGKNFKVDTK